MQGFPQGAPGGGQYEFSEVENQTIQSTASAVSWWGIVSIIVALLLGLGALGSIGVMVAGEFKEKVVFPMLIVFAALSGQALYQLIVGFMYMSVGGSLKQVVTTQGDDVGLLMKSLGKLGNAFTVEGVVLLLAVVFGILANVGGQILQNM